MNHLPECTASHQHVDYLCICEQLRACEQRVLGAAREAVLAVDPFNKAELLLKQEDVIAAIDSLRGNNAIY